MNLSQNKNQKILPTFVATYTDTVKFNRKPNEDFYLFSRQYPIFVIADGVTQSCFKSGGYAFPAGAKAAAEIFCYSILEFLEKNFQTEHSKILIEKAFDLANLRIKGLNQAEGITEKLDYAVYDYFDTVGVVGLIFGSNLYYGYVGDCGLMILNKENKILFQTKDMVAPALRQAKKFYKKKWDTFTKRKKLLILHKEFRNNPSGIGYGSFSGEEWVKKYYTIGNFPLKKEDFVIFYSDGFVPYLKFKEFLKLLRRRNKKNLEKFIYKKADRNYQKFGTDRTLIAIEL